MYAYYITRGHDLNDLINLSYTEKVFYSEAMRYEIEKDIEKYNRLMGGGN